MKLTILQPCVLLSTGNGRAGEQVHLQSMLREEPYVQGLASPFETGMNIVKAVMGAAVFAIPHVRPAYTFASIPHPHVCPLYLFIVSTLRPSRVV